MIFPIRCVSCNNVIAGKWIPYLEKVKEHRKNEGKSDTAEMDYLTATTTKSAEGKALDDLGVKKICCRRHFLTHVDL